MIEQRLIFEIHRQKDLGLANRAIAKTLKVGRDTIAKYLENPHPQKPMLLLPPRLPTASYKTRRSWFWKEQAIEGRKSKSI